MWMEEVTLLFQVAHRVSDGRWRHAEAELVGETPGTGWLSRLDVSLNYGFENPSFALIQTWE
jgi:hypothetical protein